QIENIDELVDFQNLEQLEQSLQKTVIHLCEKIERKTESYNEQLRRNIIEYIHSNYKNYDLSLESMARHFNLSVPYLSSFVKEQVGETFIHYVFELRLRDVKYELTYCDKLIKDIIVGVGYTDVSNFSREFKKAEKITPFQYRKLNRSLNAGKIRLQSLGLFFHEINFNTIYANTIKTHSAKTHTIKDV